MTEIQDHPAGALTTSMRREMRDFIPRSPGQLHSFVRFVLGFRVPCDPIVAGHDSPSDYLVHSFFEGAQSAPERADPAAGVSADCIVWANRGGGKTQLGAIATLLDMVFKPGIEIRILGGSFEQSAKMHRYLKRLLESEVFSDLVAGHFTGRFVELTNGSRVEVLSQSERSVRGQRVHKMRCDEVDLFDQDVWDAAQLVTRSGMCGTVHVRGAVEAFSTMHRPFGLMQTLVRDSPAARRRVFRWSAMDVLEHCPTWRVCESCSLWDHCQGRAKQPHIRGFLHIDDAIQQRRRIGHAVWHAEMLCESPSRSDCVYPEFDPLLHVIPDDPVVAAPKSGPLSDPTGISLVRAASHGPDADRHMGAAARTSFIGGVDFGMRAPTVVLWAVHDSDVDVITVFDELLMADQTADRVIDQVLARISRDGTRKDLIKTYFQGSRFQGWFGADPAGHQRNEHTGVSTISLWKRAGFTIRTRISRIHEGVQAVRARLRHGDDSIGLRIHARCTHLIEAMSEYHYPLNSAGDDRADPVKDGPDHACDALRYMIINLDHHHRAIDRRGY